MCKISAAPAYFTALNVSHVKSWYSPLIPFNRYSPRVLGTACTDPLLAQVHAPQRHLQDVLLVGVDVQPAARLLRVGPRRWQRALRLLLAPLPPALHAHVHLQHGEVTQEGPGLKRREGGKRHISDTWNPNGTGGGTLCTQPRRFIYSAFSRREATKKFVRHNNWAATSSHADVLP